MLSSPASLEADGGERVTAKLAPPPPFGRQHSVLYTTKTVITAHRKALLLWGIAICSVTIGGIFSSSLVISTRPVTVRRFEADGTDVGPGLTDRKGEMLEMRVATVSQSSQALVQAASPRTQVQSFTYPQLNDNGGGNWTNLIEDELNSNPDRAEEIQEWFPSRTVRVSASTWLSPNRMYLEGADGTTLLMSNGFTKIVEAPICHIAFHGGEPSSNWTAGPPVSPSLIKETAFRCAAASCPLEKCVGESDGFDLSAVRCATTNVWKFPTGIELTEPGPRADRMLDSCGRMRRVLCRRSLSENSAPSRRKLCGGGGYCSTVQTTSTYAPKPSYSPPAWSDSGWWMDWGL